MPTAASGLNSRIILLASPVEVTTLLQRGEVVLDVLHGEAAVDVRYAHGAYLIARARDEVRLHAPLGADEQKLALRRGGLYRARHGERRVYVPRGPAAGEKKPHIITSWERRLRCRRMGGFAFAYNLALRDAERTMPISASWSISAVPP